MPGCHSEERVNYYYCMMRSLSRGDAILKYLEIIQSLPMYSVHYFEVKVREEEIASELEDWTGKEQLPHYSPLKL